MGRKVGMISHQLSFQGKDFKRPKDWFGGAKLKGNPRTKRPLSSKYAVHTVLRAQKSQMRKAKVHVAVNTSVTRICKKHGVRLYEYANVGNHLHLLIRLPSVRAWAAFIRELTGRIAQIAGELKGQEAAPNFWKHRPFTRIVRGWQKAYRLAKDYVWMNVLEGEGIRREHVRWSRTAAFSGP